MQTHFTALDAVILVVYFLGTMGIGVYFYSRSRSTENFTAAGRSLPGWVCGLSIFATYLSSISFLALPGSAFAGNWNRWVFSLSIPLAAWIAVRWFMPYYRRSGEVSAYSHLEHRFGPWARVYASTCYLLIQIVRMGAVMYLTALPMHVLLGWDIMTIIVITGICVTIYSFMGGIVAVIWADALQSVVLIGGALLCLALMIFSMPEGPGQLISIGMEHNKFSLGSFSMNLAESTFWVVLIYGLFTNLQNFGIDQNYVQRYIASKSDREARKSVWLGALLYVPVSAVFFLIGTALFAYYLAHPTELPPAYATSETDRVFPFYIVTVLPPGVTGLLIAAIFAAAMSTVSTSLNSSATLLMSDYYKRFINPAATEKQSMLVLYGGTIVWGVLGTGVAMGLVHVAGAALDAWWMLSGIFSGGMLGLFLLGMISRRAGNPAAITGVVIGILVILWMTISAQGWWPQSLPSSPFHGFMIIVIGTLAILLIGLLVSRLTGGSRDAEKQTSRFNSSARGLAPTSRN